MISTKAIAASFVLAAVAFPALAQEPDPVYQTGKTYKLEVKVDAVLRQEWTDTITFIEKSRQLARIRPRVEAGVGRFLFGLGADLTYGSDENIVPPPPAVLLPLLRDNFDTRDARLDLAFVRARPADWVTLHAGRFAMPVRLTEMTWDRELRPQGGALILEARDRGPFTRLALTGLFARGSHVFPQEGGAFDFSDRETVAIGAATAALRTGSAGTLELTAAYLDFTGPDHLDRLLRRQNSRATPGGLLANGYEVVDLVGRWSRASGIDLQLVADYCWNTAVEADNRGLWLAAVVGSTQTSRGSFEYTFARVDKDATLAAFAADDFLWETGWEGHRGDLGIRIVDKVALHGVAQRQRFKDSANVAERDLWLKRFRVEIRARY